jgi:hypothetical protein
MKESMSHTRVLEMETSKLAETKRGETGKEHNQERAYYFL